MPQLEVRPDRLTPDAQRLHRRMVRLIEVSRRLSQEWHQTKPRQVHRFRDFAIRALNAIYGVDRPEVAQFDDKIWSGYFWVENPQQKGPRDQLCALPMDGYDPKIARSITLALEAAKHRLLMTREFVASLVPEPVACLTSEPEVIGPAVVDEVPADMVGDDAPNDVPSDPQIETRPLATTWGPVPTSVSQKQWKEGMNVRLLATRKSAKQTRPEAATECGSENDADKWKRWDNLNDPTSPHRSKIPRLLQYMRDHASELEASEFTPTDLGRLRKPERARRKTPPPTPTS